MKQSLLAFLPVLLPAIVNAQYKGQELVRNGGFEMLDRPVLTYDQISAATGWGNATLGLSEVFVPTAPAKTVGIPVNDYGTMEPFEGEHYAGFFGWKDDVRRNFGASDPEDVFVPGWGSYSEYIQGELLFPLVEGAEYELVFQVALAGNSDRTIMGIGAAFTEERVQAQHRKFLELIPDVYMEKAIRERGKWVEVRETFKAEGDERFIILGVFPYAGLESRRIIEGHDNQYAYYYIDGVSLKKVEKD